MLFIGGSAHGKNIQVRSKDGTYRVPLKRTNLDYAEERFPYLEYREMRFITGGVVGKCMVIKDMEDDEAIVLLNQILLKDGIDKIRGRE